MKLHAEFKHVEALVRGIVNAYGKKIEENAKLVDGYKATVTKTILEKPHLIGGMIKHNLKENPSLSSLLKMFFNNKELRLHYTEKGATELVMGCIGKQMELKKSWTLNDEDFKSAVSCIEQNLSDLKPQTYAFQLLHLQYTGPDVEFGICKLTTFDNQVKVYGGDLLKLFPLPDPRYRNFIVVKLDENDTEIAYQRAIQYAKNLVAVLKLKDYKTPLLGLHDAYFVQHKDGWSVGYHNSQVLNWDMALSGDDAVKKVLAGFEELFENLPGSDLCDALFFSLNRFAYARTIEQPSFRLAEVMGCIESLMSQRSDTSKQCSDGKAESLQDILLHRIFTFIGVTDEKEYYAAIFKNHYEERSLYTHQSALRDVEKEASAVIRLYTTLVEQYLTILNEFKSKGEFLKDLDKKSKTTSGIPVNTPPKAGDTTRQILL